MPGRAACAASVRSARQCAAAGVGCGSRAVAVGCVGWPRARHACAAAVTAANAWHCGPRAVVGLYRSTRGVNARGGDGLRGEMRHAWAGVGWGGYEAAYAVALTGWPSSAERSRTRECSRHGLCNATQRRGCELCATLNRGARQACTCRGGHVRSPECTTCAIAPVGARPRGSGCARAGRKRKRQVGREKGKQSWMPAVCGGNRGVRAQAH